MKPVVGMVCYPTYGGSGVIASELAQGLVERGFEVHVMSLARPVRLNTVSPRLFFHEVKGVEGWPYDHSWYDVALANMMVGLVKTAGLGLIHVHYAMPHAVSAYLARQMLRAQGMRVPIITTLHGTDVTYVSEHPSFAAVMKFVMAESDGLTAVSQSLADGTHRQFNFTRRIEVIPNGVNVERFRPARRSTRLAPFKRDRHPVIMHVSNFRLPKRTPDVVEIFARVRANLRATLVMVGDGAELDQAMERAKQLGVAEDVRWLGKQDAVETLLPHADVFLLPSEKESFGLAALEAMACGVPVVASRVGGLPEVVRHGVDGYLEASGDVEAMAQRCLEVLKAPALAKRLGRAGRQRAEREFGINLMVSQYERYYQRILKGGKES